MNLNAEALAALCQVFYCRLADMEGVEPPIQSLSRDRGAPVHTPFDSFPDYRLVKSDQGQTDALLSVLTRLFHR